MNCALLVILLPKVSSNSQMLIRILESMEYNHGIQKVRQGKDDILIEEMQTLVSKMNTLNKTQKQMKDEMHSQLHEQAIKLRKVDVIMEMSRAIENQTKQINEFQHEIMKMQNILDQKINEIDCSVNIDITKEESKKPCDIQPVPQLKPQPNINKYSV